jgi:hypothetical protein
MMVGSGVRRQDHIGHSLLYCRAIRSSYLRRIHDHGQQAPGVYLRIPSVDKVSSIHPAMNYVTQGRLYIDRLIAKDHM